MGVEDQVRPLADSLVEDLTNVEGEMKHTRNKSGQDPIRFPPMLDNHYVALYEYVTGSDNYRFGGPEGRPSSGAYELFGDLNARWTAISNRLQQVLLDDVGRFNALIERLGVGAVVIPGRSGELIP